MVAVLMATAPKLGRAPTLRDLLEDPLKVAELPREAIAQLRGELARLDTLLLTVLLSSANGGTPAAADGDRLLDVKAAAHKLGTTEDWLYRNAATLPFVIRVGSKQLRFSETGIERYITQRAGR